MELLGVLQKLPIKSGEGISSKGGELPVSNSECGAVNMIL